MVPDRALQPQDLAIALDFAPESFRPVEGLAGLRQQFEPSAVFDPIFGRDPVP
jgi:hypothetical protein